MKVTKTFYTPHLPAVVKKITVITEDSMDSTLNAMTYFADGLPGIMFQQSDEDMILNKDGQKLSRLILYGQTVKPVEISTTGSFKVIIFHLYAHVIKALFGIEAQELTDTCIDYSLLPCKDAPDLKNRLLDKGCTYAQINLIIQSLQRLLYHTPLFSASELYYATESIKSSAGSISLRTLQKELQVSERTFERKFLQHVGVTPRLFRRICKFHAALHQLESNSFDNLTDVAYSHGFSDQSHFIRTFKEFTGFTPGEYLMHFAETEQSLEDCL